MKKIVFLILFSLVFLFSVNVSLAQETQQDSLATPSSKAQIEYLLPYPGLLPDSPIYFFKVTRDKIISLLIGDPIKKAEFDLLQADKRLSSGAALFSKGKEGLAITTISKGQNYFDEALQKAKEGKKQGLNSGEVFKKMSLSAKKHQEVLTDLEKKSPKNFKDPMQSLIKKAQYFEKVANSSI